MCAVWLALNLIRCASCFTKKNKPYKDMTSVKHNKLVSFENSDVWEVGLASCSCMACVCVFLCMCVCLSLHKDGIFWHLCFKLLSRIMIFAPILQRLLFFFVKQIFNLLSWPRRTQVVFVCVEYISKSACWWNGFWGIGFWYFDWSIKLWLCFGAKLGRGEIK